MPSTGGGALVDLERRVIGILTLAPTEAAGWRSRQYRVRVEDTITTIGRESVGQPRTSSPQFSRPCSPGQNVEVVVVRTDGANSKRLVTLGELPGS